MATNEEIFYKEFNRMMQQLKARNGVVNLNEIPLPTDIDLHQEHSEIVAINGIEDEYYSKLNDTTPLLWGNRKLKRRKFDFRGEFMKDDNGNYIYLDVPLPRDCIAVISDIKLGVPLKYKPTESFDYVDMIKRNDGKVFFIYIVPKHYCYKVNQVALVMNVNKMRVYYDGVSLALKNGSTIYLYAIPYKPTNQPKGYRIICTKTSLNFDTELKAIRDYWLKNSIIFDVNKCVITEGIRSRNNMAVEVLPTVLDYYELYDISKPLSEYDYFSGLEDGIEFSE